MLRSVEDETRAFAADAVQIFLSDVAQPNAGDEETEDYLFYRAVCPFLETVWPKEKSLATPGISEAFADLPATAKGAFASAVKSVEPYLVPFDCWSLIDFGLYDNSDIDKPNFTVVQSSRDAESLLTLLDCCIGSSQDSVVPYDLSDALDHILTVSSYLSNSPGYRRLATLTRR
jgi:hypothetical protein